MAGLSRPVQLQLTNICELSATPIPEGTGLGSFPFARRYLGNRLFFLFLRVLRCFSSPGVPLIHYGFMYEYQLFTGGFPHSEICGSRPICGYPQLIAAYHVLHRLLVPRHPPCALISLIMMLVTLACCAVFKELSGLWFLKVEQ